MLVARDARILGAVGERMTFTGDPRCRASADTAALQTIDTALLQLPPEVPQQLSWALLLFEYGPPLFLGKLASFTGLRRHWQDVYLDGWAESRFQTRRIAFQAFKNLAMLGYYSQDATWPAIHYTALGAQAAAGRCRHDHHRRPDHRRPRPHRRGLRHRLRRRRRGGRQGARRGRARRRRCSSRAATTRRTTSPSAKTR